MGNPQRIPVAITLLLGTLSQCGGCSSDAVVSVTDSHTRILCSRYTKDGIAYFGVSSGPVCRDECGQLYIGDLRLCPSICVPVHENIYIDPSGNVYGYDEYTRKMCVMYGQLSVIRDRDIAGLNSKDEKAVWSEILECGPSERRFTITEPIFYPRRIPDQGK